MPQQANKSFQLEAIHAVFNRLGGANVDMIRQNLRSDYKIDLDSPDAFTLEELQIALQRLVGEYAASLLIREISFEIRLLQSSS